MERPTTKPFGVSANELDTPALVVDLPTLDYNIETVHSFFRSAQSKVRPFASAHLCPAIASRQLMSDGSVGGISVATIGEAEVFAQHGISDITIVNRVVTWSKLNRLCALAHLSKVTVGVDTGTNVEDLSEAAIAAGVTLNVLVDVNTGSSLWGVDPGNPTLRLAQTIKKAPGLQFGGLAASGTFTSQENDTDAVGKIKHWVQPVLTTRELLEHQGINVDVVSAGDTSNYTIIGSIDGITEVPAGSYALMDTRYLGNSPQLKPAVKILSTVTSRPDRHTSILDAGQKSSNRDTGLPSIEGFPKATVTSTSAEHATVELDEDMENMLGVGDKVWLIPHDAGGCANLYDYMRIVRNGKLIAMWEIAARGRYR